MKTSTLIILLLLLFSGLQGQTTHVVQVSGFAFDPANLTIQAGDSVRFEGSPAHPVLQVSQTTWNANGTSPLAGGFSFPEGSGKVGFPNAGTYYYVCTFHVESHQMKGKIVVTAVTGLDPTEKSDQRVIYPVPLTGDELTLQLNEEGSVPVVVKVFDVSGKQVRVFEGNTMNGLFRMNCSGLDKGMYLFSTQAHQTFSITKLVRL